jgi:2-polyprenyl-3-methyl-5-hydroxy-6-metoxy-1,4-benzoquinol methylase
VTEGAGEDLDIDRLVGQLRERVEQRRRDGDYPEGLEEALAEHFDRLVERRPSVPSATYEELKGALGELGNFAYGPGSFSDASDLPGGAYAHRLVGRLVSRHIAAVLERSETHARLVTNTLRLLNEVLNTIQKEVGRISPNIDDLQVRLAVQQRALNAFEQSLLEMSARVPGSPISAWYSDDEVAAMRRGRPDDVGRSHRDLVEELIDSGPVLDLGAGRGDLVELLHELGVEASGIEPDPRLASMARGRGLDVGEGRPVEHLAAVPDLSLGGIVMINVIEYLPPQHVIDIVKLASEKVRPGGKVIVETVNPSSLASHADAPSVDLEPARPVHPSVLEFLFTEAGFRDFRRVDRSPVPEDETLELLPGDDEIAKRLNANFERLNSTLFGARAYALIATR